VLEQATISLKDERRRGAESVGIRIDNAGGGEYYFTVVKFGEPPLSGNEQALIRLRWRYGRATRALGVNRDARSIYWLLHLEKGCWPLQALAREVGITQSTTNRICKRNEAAGYFKHCKREGYCITEMGSDVLLRVHRETLRIACGGQIGFSPEVIKLYRDLGFRNVSPDAVRISFPQNLPFFFDT
jgi:DNA-binding MarR family transcriptional regulator